MHFSAGGIHYLNGVNGRFVCKYFNWLVALCRIWKKKYRNIRQIINGHRFAIGEGTIGLKRFVPGKG